jgi:hypothetical protein
MQTEIAGFDLASWCVCAPSLVLVKKLLWNAVVDQLQITWPFSLWCEVYTLLSFTNPKIG